MKELPPPPLRNTPTQSVPQVIWIVQGACLLAMFHLQQTHWSQDPGTSPPAVGLAWARMFHEAPIRFGLAQPFGVPPGEDAPVKGARHLLVPPLEGSAEVSQAVAAGS